MSHTAIVITGRIASAIDEAAATASSLGLQVLGPSKATFNGYRSILICADGNETGSIEQFLGANQRSQFVAWIETKNHASAYELDHLEIEYGNCP